MFEKFLNPSFCGILASENKNISHLNTYFNCSMTLKAELSDAFAEKNIRATERRAAPLVQYDTMAGSSQANFILKKATPI